MCPRGRLLIIIQIHLLDNADNIDNTDNADNIDNADNTDNTDLTGGEAVGAKHSFKVGN